MPATKLSALKKYMGAGQWREALKLAAKFPRLGDHKSDITRAWAALSNPKLYKQMGYDPEQVYKNGIDALKNRYL